MYDLHEVQSWSMSIQRDIIILIADLVHNKHTVGLPDSKHKE